MESADSSEWSKVKAFSVAGLLIVVGVADLIAYVNAVFEAPKTSPWTSATIINMIFGAVFAVGYLVTRNGPAVLCIPGRVFAFLWILVANFALLWYIAYMIIRDKDISVALLPYSDGRLASVIPMRTDRERRKSQLTIVFACLVVMALLGVGVWAVIIESPVDEWKLMVANKWTQFIYTDCVTGLVFVAVYVAAREGGVCTSAMLWIVGVLLFGNITTFAYVAAMGVQAIRGEIPFSHVMLSTRDTLS